MIAAGQSIGNYRILNKIGTGGMGAVYLAEHPLIGKRVALKVIHRELAGNRDVVSRFFQEARAVNKIGNEHIVEIHDFGVTPEGDHFYIMEYLEGRTLAEVLSHEKALDVMRALHVGAQIAHALAAAHVAGIVHRDLKPDNIMLMVRLGEQDFVKVLDFGLAKVFSAATAVKTAAGVLLGTPQYMSPEACESKRDIDHRTDIYALGVLLFQMMTGVLPFDGETMGEVLVKQVATLPPAPRALNPSIPPSVEQILLRCLAKPVDARFPTMLQLRQALLDPEAYLRGSPPIAPARSVTSAFALGEANTVALQAAPDPGPIPASMQITRVATGALPLPAPLPSMIAISGAASAPTLIAENPPLRRPTAGIAGHPQQPELKMNTMRIATPVGYSSRPPRRVWPAVLGMAVLLGVAGGIVSVTCFGREGASRPGAAELRAPAGTGGEPPGSAAVTGTASAGTGTASTGTVGTGAAGAGTVGTGTASTGNVAVPPANGSASASGSGVAATEPRTAMTSAGTASTGTASAGTASTGTVSTGTASTGTASTGTASTGTASTGTASTGTRRAGAAGRIAHLTIESVPVGATVKGPDGSALGKTPLALEWPASDAPVRFELRLAGYKMKPKQTVINGNTRLVIELERAPVRRSPAGQRSGGRSNGLMRPDD